MTRYIRYTPAALLAVALIGSVGSATAQDQAGAPDAAAGAAEAKASGEVEAPSAEEVVATGTMGGLEALEDSQLASLEVSKVQPVLFQSTDDGAQVRAIFGVAQTAEPRADQTLRLKDALVTPEVPEGVGEEGFDFAGDSTQLDVVSLQYGYVLGALPALKQMAPEQFGAMQAKLGAMRKLDAAYSQDTQAQIKAYADALAKGDLDTDAYLGMMRAATRGIAQAGDPAVERRHGYLLLGLWSGLTTLAVETESGTQDLKHTGEALVMMLEKDATYGGSDMALAKKVRAVNAKLGGESPGQGRRAQGHQGHALGAGRPKVSERAQR